jgi:RNA polymerase sigma-70 factor (ECF subfamily)
MSSWCEAEPVLRGAIPDADDARAIAARRETDLVERARSGDLNAYGVLVRRHGPLAHRMAFTITRDAGDAEEAVQDAFVKAYRALPRFRRGAPFKPWLMRIVINEAKSRLRSTRRRTVVVASVVEQAEGEAATARSAEATFLSHEQRRALVGAIDHLSEKLRDVITCRYLLELSEEETAAALSIRPGTVKSRLSRALEKLEPRLAANV